MKRVEKLLHLSDKRLVQSATTLAKQNKKKAPGKRKRRGPDGEEDEILEIAETVERTKRQKKGRDAEGGEEVLLKGTGKAIQKVMELGLWFQQREEYVVRLRTGSVGAIDDIFIHEGDALESCEDAGGEGAEEMEVDIGAGAERGGDGDEVGEAMAVGPVEITREPACDIDAGEKGKVDMNASPATTGNESIPETRIRYTSCLEVAVSLR